MNMRKATKLRAPSQLVRKVREVAVALGIPEDQAQQIRVGITEQANSSSTGQLGSNATVAFPRYSTARTMNELADITDGLTILGKKINFRKNKMHQEKLGQTMLWSDQHLAFVIGHELSHLVHGDGASWKPKFLRLGAKFSSSFSDQLFQYHREIEFAADHTAGSISPQVTAGGIEHLTKIKQRNLFTRDLALRMNMECPIDEDGEDLLSKTHPTLAERIERLQSIWKNKE